MHACARTPVFGVPALSTCSCLDLADASADGDDAPLEVTRPPWGGDWRLRAREEASCDDALECDLMLEPVMPRPWLRPAVQGKGSSRGEGGNVC